MNKALFLDRDGVVNKEKIYLYKIEDFEFINGVIDVCRHFQGIGYLIVIITNQAGIAKGKYTENDYNILTKWMIKEFEKEGVFISKVYYCPHHPDVNGICGCRKPKPKMIFNAQKEFNIDLTQSILVGDKNSDIEAGLNANIATNYLITTGHKIKENIFGVGVIDNLKKLI
jgi:D-glycero-D-manno-heptose 1,7-bisphosphate phosphatase